MKFSIYINQAAAKEFGLSLQESFCFAYMYESYGKPWMACEEDGFCWLSKSLMARELPLLTDKPDTIYRYWKRIETAGLIECKKQGRRDLFRLTELAEKWNSAPCGNSEDRPSSVPNSDDRPSSAANSENNPSKVGKKSELNSENNPTDQINKNIKYTRDQRRERKDARDPVPMDNSRIATPSEQYSENPRFDEIRKFYRAFGQCKPADAKANYARLVDREGRHTEFANGLQDYLNQKATQRKPSYQRLENFIREESWRDTDQPVVEGSIRVPGASDPPSAERKSVITDEIKEAMRQAQIESDRRQGRRV